MLSPMIIIICPMKRMLYHQRESDEGNVFLVSERGDDSFVVIVMEVITAEPCHVFLSAACQFAALCATYHVRTEIVLSLFGEF